MSYEYKDEILLDIGPEPNCNYPSEAANYYAKINELDHVYAQAALNKEKIKQIEETYKVRYSEHIELKRKADEYEAKAKLMDNIYAELKKRDGEAIDSLNVDYYDFGVYVARTIEEYESECDSNA